MAKDGSKGKVIDFRSARKPAEPPAQMKAAANAPSSPRGGFLDAWLKNHEDDQALIRENLSLKEQQRRLEEERSEFIPNAQESILYYATLGIATLMLIATMAAIFLKETSL